MRERLREREALLMRGAQYREELAADRVGITFTIADRVECRLETRVVMRKHLIHAARQIIEGIAVRGQHP